MLRLVVDTSLSVLNSASMSVCQPIRRATNCIGALVRMLCFRDEVGWVLLKLRINMDWCLRTQVKSYLVLIDFAGAIAGGIVRIG